MELAVRTLTARNGLAVVALDVRQLCSFADYFIIASGASKRQVLALAGYVQEALTQAGVKPLGQEGIQEGVWVLLDYNDVVIHLFIEPFREFYHLEGLWAEAPRLTAAVLKPSPLPSGPTKADQDRVRHG